VIASFISDVCHAIFFFSFFHPLPWQSVISFSRKWTSCHLLSRVQLFSYFPLVVLRSPWVKFW
jgi:hypothetical protein